MSIYNLIYLQINEQVSGYAYIIIWIQLIEHLRNLQLIKFSIVAVFIFWRPPSLNLNSIIRLFPIPKYLT